MVERRMDRYHLPLQPGLSPKIWPFSPWPPFPRQHGLLIAHLLEDGWPVYPVNPRTVDRRRSASGAKTDTIDAYLLAKTGRADLADLHRLTPDSEKVAELKLLTRDQDALIQTQTRLVNQLTA